MTKERIYASPLARRIAQERGIELKTLKGSGPKGRIILRDLAQGPSGGSAPAFASGSELSSLPDPRLFYDKTTYDEIPLDSMRHAIAKRLVQAKREIPHIYLSVACNLDRVLRIRKLLNSEHSDLRLSVNDFIVKAMALALMKFPDANVSFANNALLKHKSADVGVAVSIPGGLITPIVRDAHLKGLRELSSEIKDLAQKARSRKLKPNQYEGGTCSVSNLGMFKMDAFCAIINPPQASILAVGQAKKMPIAKEDGQLGVGNIMQATLSCDHRAIDGALGAQLLDAFRAIIEKPVLMML